MRVLLVEDDTMIGPAVQDGLARRGLRVDWVRDGAAGLSAASTEPFDAVLLDIGLPRLDGLALLKALRASADPVFSQVPVLLVTARDAVTDRIAGLDAGADDYVLKPFDIDELAARLRAVSRRRDGRTSTTMTAAGMSLDTASREVRVDGQPVSLSAREFGLLELLMRRPGVAQSRAQLEDRLLGWGEEVASNALEVHIHNLRRKLGAQRVLNIRGVGYFVPR